MDNNVIIAQKMMEMTNFQNGIMNQKTIEKEPSKFLEGLLKLLVMKDEIIVLHSIDTVNDLLSKINPISKSNVSLN